MSFLVDTNVLVHAADPDSDFHSRCAHHLETWRRQATPWYLSWPICYEFLRVCTHPRVFRQPRSITVAWRFLQEVLAAPSAQVLLPTARHSAVFGQVIAEVPQMRGNILHDAHTAVLMREHGIKEIYTRDMDFHRFAFLRVLDPTA